MSKRTKKARAVAAEVSTLTTTYVALLRDLAMVVHGCRCDYCCYREHEVRCNGKDPGYSATHGPEAGCVAKPVTDRLGMFGEKGT